MGTALLGTNHVLLSGMAQPHALGPGTTAPSEGSDDEEEEEEDEGAAPHPPPLPAVSLSDGTRSQTSPSSAADEKSSFSRSAFRAAPRCCGTKGRGDSCTAPAAQREGSPTLCTPPPLPAPEMGTGRIGTFGNVAPMQPPERRAVLAGRGPLFAFPGWELFARSFRCLFSPFPLPRCFSLENWSCFLRAALEGTAHPCGSQPCVSDGDIAVPRSDAGKCCPAAHSDSSTGIGL